MPPVTSSYAIPDLCPTGSIDPYTGEYRQYSSYAGERVPARTVLVRISIRAKETCVMPVKPVTVKI